MISRLKKNTFIQYSVSLTAGTISIALLITGSLSIHLHLRNQTTSWLTKLNLIGAIALIIFCSNASFVIMILGCKSLVRYQKTAIALVLTQAVKNKNMAQKIEQNHLVPFHKIFFF